MSQILKQSINMNKNIMAYLNQEQELEYNDYN